MRAPPTDDPAKAAAAHRPVSLRVRLLVFGILVLAGALGLVGLALDGAFARSAETELRNQMETWVYLTLGATEVNADGAIAVRDDLGDPRLARPGSRVYAHVHGAQDHWTSPSALGIALPELEPVPAGQQSFFRSVGDPPLLVYQYGVGWELANGRVLPFTVTVLADPALLAPQIGAFRAGLWRSLGAAGLILALAQFLFLWLALRPFRQVAQDVAEIETGARERLDGPYPAELEPLTRNLDRLLATEKANQQRYRSALDSLAHSLKTPLAVIRAALPKTRGPEVAAMEDAVADMQHMITSRLQWAAASTRRTHATPVPVRPVAERLLNSLRKVHSQKMIRIDVNMEPGLLFHGEERDLMEVLGNLLDNACKYGDGAVRVSAGRDNGSLRLTVENGGRPIPGERVERLLQRGVRGDERERIEGHGLGLTIVTELVSAYGGDIRIEESELGGAAVSVRFPDA